MYGTPRVSDRSRRCAGPSESSIWPPFDEFVYRSQLASSCSALTAVERRILPAVAGRSGGQAAPRINTVVRLACMLHFCRRRYNGRNASSTSRGAMSRLKRARARNGIKLATRHHRTMTTVECHLIVDNGFRPTAPATSPLPLPYGCVLGPSLLPFCAQIETSHERWQVDRKTARAN